MCIRDSLIPAKLVPGPPVLDEPPAIRSLQDDAGLTPATDVFKSLQPVDKTRTDLIPLRSNVAGAKLKLTADIQYEQWAFSRQSILPAIIP